MRHFSSVAGACRRLVGPDVDQGYNATGEEHQQIACAAKPDRGKRSRTRFAPIVERLPSSFASSSQRGDKKEWQVSS